MAKEKGSLHEKGNVRGLPAHFGPKVGAATAVALLALTGVAAAAVTGSLPAPLQSFVHARIGAIAGPPTALSHTGHTGVARLPAASRAPSASAAPPGPSAVPGVGPVEAGGSRAGLCRAFDEAKTKSSKVGNGAAARTLEVAAAAAGQSVEAYCSPYASAGKPTNKSGGKIPTPKPSTSQHGHGSKAGAGNRNSRGNSKP